MRAPQGLGGFDLYAGGTYTTIVPLERLEYTQGLTDKDGNRINPTTMGMPPNFPREFRSALEFKRVGDRTELTATEYDWAVGPMRDQSEAGLSSTLDKLEETLRA